MFKKSLFLCLCLSIVLTGCLERKFEAPPETSSNSDSATEKILSDIEKKEGKNLTEEEIAALEKLENAESDKKLEEDYNLVNKLEELEDNKKTGSAARGSCNAIIEGSTCIDYVGSMWTEQQMSLNCEGAGIYSAKPCPDGMAGGCNIGLGTITDMVTWFYYTGGGEITPDSLFSAKEVCGMTPMARWIVK